MCTEHAASLALQDALGFDRVGRLREVGFKFGRWLDVAYAQLILEPTGAPSSASRSVAADGSYPVRSV
jgi:L-amino acid N-acyltransferase YncA